MNCHREGPLSACTGHVTRHKNVTPIAGQKKSPDLSGLKGFCKGVRESFYGLEQTLLT